MAKQLTPDESLSRIKSQLILSYIFWATLLLKMRCEFDNNISTACTDGETIKLSAKFWESLSSDEQKFILAHELAHCLLKHHLRKGHRNHRLWNIACDLVVNLLLKDAGFTLPEDVLLNDKYKDMTAEAVYAIIEKDPQYEDGNGKGDGKWGWDFGEVKEYDGPDPQANEQEWNGRIQQAIQASKSCGQGSAMLDRLAEATKRSRVPWKEVCQRFVQVRAKNDYDMRQPNRRYTASDMYLPCLRSFEIGKILFIGDSSGSIGEEEINIAASEIQAAALTVKAEFWIMWVDDEVRGDPVEIPLDQYPLKLKPKGYGGTDFKPGFEWIDKENFDPVCVIYITDGFCNSFPNEPDYPVLWLVTSKDKFNAPFGEVTYYFDV
jgi:predicted metal-dependent peptidase